MKRTSFLCFLGFLGFLSNPKPADALLLPSSTSLKDRQVSLESHLLVGAQAALVTRGAIGLGDGFEAGLSYLHGFPPSLFSGPAIDLRYQLVSPTWARPTSVATGLMYVGVPGNSYGLSNNAFLTLGHDLNATLDGKGMTLLSLRFGFLGDLNLRARMLAGVDIPLGTWGDVNLDYLGEQASVPALFNLGVRTMPLGPVSLCFTSLAIPGKAWWDRSLALGVRYVGSR